MPELPAEAVQAATLAHERWYIDHGGDPDAVYWTSHEQWASATLEAAAPFLAGVGSPVSCPSAAPESTQSPETPEVAPVYRSGVEHPAETLSALREENERLRAALAHYENTITWHTTCHNCASLLDRCYEADMRREQAEGQALAARAALAAIRTIVDGHRESYGHLDGKAHQADGDIPGHVIRAVLDQHAAGAVPEEQTGGQP